LFSNDIGYFNGESETVLRPYVITAKAKKCAIPETFYFIFETAKGASYNCEVFFDWDKLHTILEKKSNRRAHFGSQAKCYLHRFRSVFRWRTNKNRRTIYQGK